MSKMSGKMHKWLPNEPLILHSQTFVLHPVPMTLFEMDISPELIEKRQKRFEGTEVQHTELHVNID